MRMNFHELSDLSGVGPVGEFERTFAEVCGSKYAVALSNGTAAVHTALIAAGLGPGHEVIVSPFTWPQSDAPVLFTGAALVFADIDPATWHLDIEAVARLITNKTRAIIVPNLFGHGADLPDLELLAKSAGAFLITDSAHALGAELHGKPVGSFGDMACFSLGHGKLVSCGEGGVLATDDVNLYECAVALTQHPDRVFRETGIRHHGLSLNYRLSPLLAKLALDSLMEMQTRLTHRKDVLEAFRSGLGEQSSLRWQQTQSGEESAAYGIALSYKGPSDGREGLLRLALENGLPLSVGPVGEPLHLSLQSCAYPKPVPHFTHQPGACPVAEELCFNKSLWVMGAAEMDQVTPGQAFELGRGLADLTVRNKISKKRLAC